MNKKAFIGKVSKINDTHEDEFWAEFNSPQLMWKKVLSNAMFWNKITDGKPTKNGQYLTFLRDGKTEIMIFSEFKDGKFEDPLVSHWAHITKP